jgi:P-type Cu+ transporter
VSPRPAAGPASGVGRTALRAGGSAGAERPARDLETPSTQPSSSVCPGCAKPVDTLRAGHVAIYDGVFLYYCDASCKALHLREIASHLGDDVPTLDPPAVAARLATHPNGHAASSHAANGHAANGHNGANGAHPSPAAFSAPLPPVAPTAPPSPSFLSASTVAPAIEAAPSSPELPRTLRSPVPPRPPSSPLPELISARVASPKERARSAVSIVGAAAGLLVPLLVIGDVGLGARLAFASLAAVALIARLALTPRDLADASPLVVAVPAVGALGAAVLSFLANDPHAASIAVLAGLSASIGIAVEEAISRARGEVDATRRRIAVALDVPSRVLRGDGPSETLHDVKSGETVLVEAGDVVGVDGVASKGTAIVVPWHGATIEMEKSEGDAIVAGARIVSGALRVVTAWAGTERAWVRASCSPAVRPDVSASMARLSRSIVERAAPVVAVVSGLAAMASGGSAGWFEALAATCAVMLALGGRGVVAAVALVHARAQMRALAHGIVYRDASAFDAAGRAATAVTCSRGTVLTGEPEMVAIEQVADSGASEARILALAAGAETASTHPLANAILRAARTRGVTPESVRSATVHAGLGVTALVSSGERLVVGSRALLLHEQVSVAVAESRASELEAQGRSVLLVALAGKLIGLVALQDGLRAGARAAVQRLLDARIEPVLLSGESRETCETIARALEIDHVRPEVLPSDRGAEVRALAEGGHVVAVIGHPASDDAALGAADVAVAMGAPRAPGEWGVWLASDDVRDAALALSMAHAVRDRSRAVLAAGLIPGVVALLALAFGVGALACGPLALAVGALGSLGMSLKERR